jgi:hypothetical protein
MVEWVRCVRDHGNARGVPTPVPTSARVERMGALGTLAIVTANLALGAALVGLKLFVNHF